MQDRMIMSGIGGQGIVVGTKLIGVAATGLGLYCLHYAQYGGEMRGTLCECTLTVGDAPITSTPQVSRIEAGIIMHPESFDRVVSKIMPGGLALVNSSLIDVRKRELRPDLEWLLIPATDLGKAEGHLMVAIAAFADETKVVPSSAIKAYLPEVIPPYRHQLLEMDARGLDVGARCLATGQGIERIPASTAAYRFKDRRPLAAATA